MAAAANAVPAPPRPEWLSRSGPGNLAVPPEQWSLTLEQLIKFIDACRATATWKHLEAAKGHVTLYDLNTHFVIPWTRGTGSSVALLMNAGAPLTAEWMISHSWAEGVEELQESLETWRELRDMDWNTPVWFCLCANYQPGGAEAGDVGPSIRQQLELDPFRRVIEHLASHNGKTMGMVVVHTTLAEVYDRLWCVYEIDVAINAGVSVEGIASTQYTLTRIRHLQGMKVDTSIAKCSSTEDERMIRERVMRLGGFARLDDSIAAFRTLMVDELYKWDTAASFRATTNVSALVRVQKSVTDRLRRTSCWSTTTGSSCLTSCISSRASEPSSSLPQVSLRYPFFVVPVDRMLRMSRFEMHEDLRDEGALVEWQEGMGHVTFMSHPWLSEDHSDPDGEQLQLLQAFVRRCLAGEQRVPASAGAEMFGGAKALESGRLQKQFKDGYVWIDQCCVPQRGVVQQKHAIDSVPFYVSRSDSFLVLAPARSHADGEVRDIRTWASRGWCRLEQLSNWLAHGTMPIVVESDCLAYVPSAVTTPLFDAEYQHVADGDFTVEADREALKPVVQGFIEFHQDQALEGRDYRRFRHLASLKARLVEGRRGAEIGQVDGRQSAPDSVLQAWLKEMRFVDVNEEASTGYSPFMFAVAEGRADIVHALLKLGANVNQVLKVPLFGFGEKSTKGFTALHLACWRMHPNVVDLLLEFGADPFKRCGLGVAALHIAASRGDLTSARAILDRAPEAASCLDKCGSSFWHSALHHGQHAFFEGILARHGHLIDLHTKNHLGMVVALEAVMDTGDSQTLAAVLDAGFDANCQVQSTDMKTSFGVLAKLARWQHRRGLSQSMLSDGLAHLKGSSALHRSAGTGNLAAIRLLLSRGASTSLRNGLGQTPLHYAAEKGQAEAVDLLLRWGAPTGVLDDQGLTAADVATRRGFPLLASRLREAGRCPAAGQGPHRS